MTTAPTNSDTKSATDPGEQLNATLSQEQRRRYMLDQLGIAPQCGFASTEEGNDVTYDDQRRKLDLVVATAEAIWGEV